MTRINWRDGGGYYPPGSDTPDAPWNQPDREDEDEEEEPHMSEYDAENEYNSDEG